MAKRQATTPAAIFAPAPTEPVVSDPAPETFPERPTGASTPVEVAPTGPVIPASPPVPPLPPPGVPLTVPPVDGQRVLIDGKVLGVAFAAGKKGVEPGVRSVALYAVKSAAQSPNVQFVRYPLERLFPA